MTPSAPPYKTALQHHGNALHHPKAPQNRPELPGRILDTPELRRFPIDYSKIILIIAFTDENPQNIHTQKGRQQNETPHFQPENTGRNAPVP